MGSTQLDVFLILNNLEHGGGGVNVIPRISSQQFKMNEFPCIEVRLWMMKCDCAQWLVVGAKIESAPTVDADSSLVV